MFYFKPKVRTRKSGSSILFAQMAQPKRMHELYLHHHPLQHCLFHWSQDRLIQFIKGQQIAIHLRHSQLKNWATNFKLLLQVPKNGNFQPEVPGDTYSVGTHAALLLRPKHSCFIWLLKILTIHNRGVTVKSFESCRNVLFPLRWCLKN